MMLSDFQSDTSGQNAFYNVNNRMKNSAYESTGHISEYVSDI